MSASHLRFGDFVLDVARYELARNARPIKLERIPMELLVLLVDRRGQLVTRKEILETLWGKDVFLDADNSINTAISKLRLALKDDAEAPAFIKTVPGKGYRFICSIAVLPDAEDAIEAPPEKLPAPRDAAYLDTTTMKTEAAANNERRRSWALIVAGGAILAAVLAGWGWRDSIRRAIGFGPPPVIRSLAVLPLENLTGDPAEEYFADGMTDVLTTDLAAAGSLRVVSRTSVMHFKGTRKSVQQIAKELGVDGIVEGSVMRSGNRVRITSQVIYAPSDEHLWAKSYEREMNDVVALQGEVAQAIAAEVRATLTPAQLTRLGISATTNPGAYDAYLRGRYYWNQRTPAGAKKSIEAFEESIEKDPKFAAAYAGLADAYNFCNFLGVLAPKESAPKARVAAVKALELDPQLADAHAALGLVLSHYDFDFPGAQREFLRAIELNPNYSTAHLFYSGAYLTPMGRHQEAIAEMKKALELDPLSLSLNNIMGKTYHWAGDYERSEAQFKHTIELDPTFPLAHFFYASLLEDTERFEDAIRERQRGALLLGASIQEAEAEAEGFLRAYQSRGTRGYWERRLEGTLQDEKVAGTQYYEALAVAGAYARAGDKERAFQWIEKSYQNREGQAITLLRWLPDFKSLHTDPRFADLLARMGLPN